MLGDEELNKEQQKLLSKDAKANKKTMQLLGDVGASSGNKKIAQLMGDDMSDDDLRKMLEKDNLDVAEKVRQVVELLQAAGCTEPHTHTHRAPHRTAPQLRANSCPEMPYATPCVPRPDCDESA